MDVRRAKQGRAKPKLAHMHAQRAQKARTTTMWVRRTAKIARLAVSLMLGVPRRAKHALKPVLLVNFTSVVAVQAAVAAPTV